MLLAALCACGRLSFDPLEDRATGDGSVGDSVVPGSSWTRFASAATRVWIKRVAVGPDGSIGVTGEYAGALDLFGNSYPGINTAMFVAQLDVDGNRMWSESVGGSSTVDGRDLGFDAGENLYVHGLNTGVAMYGATSHDAGAGQDPVVLAFDANGGIGTPHWFVSTSANAQGRGISVVSSGAAIVSGSFEGTITIGSVSYSDASGMAAYVARLERDGSVPWVTSFTSSTTRIAANDVDADGDGNADTACVAGDFAGTAMLPPKMLAAIGMNDAFVARLDGGTVLWAQRIGSAALDVGTGVVETVDGGCVVVGYSSGALDFGAGAVAPRGGVDAFAARYAAGGALRWAHVLGGAGDDGAQAADDDANSDVLVAGSFQNDATFVTEPMTADGMEDGFVASIGADGALRFVHRAGGGTGVQVPYGIAVDRARRAYVVGGECRDQTVFAGEISNAPDASFVHRVLY